MSPIRATCPTYLVPLYLIPPNNIWWKIKIMNVLKTYLFSSSVFGTLLGQNVPLSIISSNNMFVPRSVIPNSNKRTKWQFYFLFSLRFSIQDRRTENFERTTFSLPRMPTSPVQRVKTYHYCTVLLTFSTFSWLEDHLLSADHDYLIQDWSTSTHRRAT